jgi:hypothetical protein
MKQVLGRSVEVRHTAKRGLYTRTVSPQAYASFYAIAGGCGSKCRFARTNTHKTYAYLQELIAAIGKETGKTSITFEITALARRRNKHVWLLKTG